MSNAQKYYKNYDYVSRYESFPYFYDKTNNKYYYGLTSSLETNDVGYTVYQVKPGDSYDSIALDHYGSALLYWVITDFNRIFDALTPPEAGTVLMLPPLNSIVYSTRWNRCHRNFCL